MSETKILEQIAYYENIIPKLREAEEIETDLDKLVKISQMLDEAEEQLIGLKIDYDQSK